MDWLITTDLTWLHLIHRVWRHAWLDIMAPYLSSNRLFLPLLVLSAAGLMIKGGVRARVFVAMVIAVLVLGDTAIVNPLKHWIGRPRPFEVVTGVEPLIGRGGSGSMPSSHASSWWAGAVLVWIYYRRFFFPVFFLAVLVGYSRVYLGVHYPTDVVVGAVVGGVFAYGFVWVLDAVWGRVGARWFVTWFDRVPNLLNPEVSDWKGRKLVFEAGGEAALAQPARVEWVRLGYLFIGVVTLLRWWYLAAGKIELSEDEAYQWLWSKHLDWSYFSKPPMIALAQWVGTSLWGDTMFGVRFLSPFIAAVIGVLLLRFFASEVSAAAGFWLVLLAFTTPLLALGGILLTVDPLSVLFWTAAMISGWRAVALDSTTRWVWTGFWIGLGFLSKYTALFQWLCWVVYFVAWAPARRQLLRPGPWLALAVMAVCALPVLWWNEAHGWVTVQHLANRGGLDQPWVPTLRFVWEFLGAELFLLNPFYVLAGLGAVAALTRSLRGQALPLYLFCMGAPLLVFYGFYALRARVQPNWIAPAILPLLSLVVFWWDSRMGEGRRQLPWLGKAGAIFGVMTVVLMHDTRLITKGTGLALPVKLDPLVRVWGWSETAKVVRVEWEKLKETAGPTFIIGDHYGITGLLSFYLPEAKQEVLRQPLVYYLSSDTPKNQFFFWPGYRGRRGENALFVQTVREPEPPPPSLVAEFAEVTDLGMRDVEYRGRVIRRIQLFACRRLQ